MRLARIATGLFRHRGGMPQFDRLAERMRIASGNRLRTERPL